MRTENLNYLAAAFNKGAARQAPLALQATLHSLTVDNRSGFSVSQRDEKNISRTSTIRSKNCQTAHCPRTRKQQRRRNGHRERCPPRRLTHSRQPSLPRPIQPTCGRNQRRQRSTRRRRSRDRKNHGRRPQLDKRVVRYKRQCLHENALCFDVYYDTVEWYIVSLCDYGMKSLNAAKTKADKAVKDWWRTNIRRSTR